MLQVGLSQLEEFFQQVMGPPCKVEVMPENQDLFVGFTEMLHEVIVRGMHYFLTSGSSALCEMSSCQRNNSRQYKKESNTSLPMWTGTKA